MGRRGQGQGFRRVPQPSRHCRRHAYIQGLPRPAAKPRWQKLAASGAWPQRLLWASTGTKDPGAPDVLYVEAPAAPDTINTMLEKTLLAFADHGKVKDVMRFDGGDAEAMLADFAREGINDETLAATLQHEGAAAFATSWSDLMERIGAKCELLTKAKRA